MSLEGPPGGDMVQERIAVIIPAYQVESRIEDVIRGIPDWVDLIVVVDDASPDETARRVGEISDPRLRLLKHEKNRGVGASVLTGFRYAVESGCTILVKMDGDGQMDPDALPGLIGPVARGEADFAKGNRFADPTTIHRMPLRRRAGNLALSFMTKMATGCWRVFDPTNGFIVLDSSVFEVLNQRLLHPRFFFEISLLFALNLQRAVIVNVPMAARYQGEPTSLSVGRALIEFPWLLFRQFVLRIWLQYFVLDFSLASLFLIAGSLLSGFGAAWGTVAWAHSIRTKIAATTGTVMLAVLPFILGFQLLIQTIVLDMTQGPIRPISKRWRARVRGQEGGPFG